MIEGHCLCGAVTVHAKVTEPKLRACHCGMCRAHTSSVFVSVVPERDSLRIDGDVRVYRSSDWAERGFCGICGSTLFYGTVHDGARYLAAGLFDGAAGGTLATEFFSDRCPPGYALADTGQDKLTTKQTIALFTQGGET